MRKHWKTIEKEVDFKKIYGDFNGKEKKIITHLGITPYIYNKLVENIINKKTTSPDDIIIIKEDNPEEVKAHIHKLFETLESVIRGVSRQVLSGVMISGPGGIGKSYTVENTLDSENCNYTKITGHISPLALYTTLYKYNLPGQVIVFDDCDSVFDSPLTLNLLKASLELRPIRRLTWLSKAGTLQNAPESFDYQGNIIFLTNKVLKGTHFEALLSRIHHFDLNFSDQEIIYRLEQVMSNIDHRGMEDIDKMEVLTYMKDNIMKFKAFGKLNMRTFIKILELKNLANELNQPDNWKGMAEVMLLKRD